MWVKSQIKVPRNGGLFSDVINGLFLFI